MTFRDDRPFIAMQMEAISGEEFTLFGAQPLDHKIIDRNLSKSQMEDVHVLNFLTVMAIHGAKSPLQILPGDDPPDRVLVGRDQARWGLELTRLGATDMQKELGTARQFGRQVDLLVSAEAESYPHLDTRTAVLARVPNGRELPRDFRPLAAEAARALKEDKGKTFAADGNPTGDGNYGDFGPFSMSVYDRYDARSPTVVGSAQVELRASEVAEVLKQTVAAKDKPGNDLLLITLSGPDQYGYTCPPDTFIWSMLNESAQEGVFSELKMKHIRAVAVHLWGTDSVFQLQEIASNQLPWCESE